MRAILANDRLAVGDLAGRLDPPSRLVLVREGCWSRSPCLRGSTLFGRPLMTADAAGRRLKQLTPDRQAALGRVLGPPPG
jgi:hypothetical protein